MNTYDLRVNAKQLNKNKNKKQGILYGMFYTKPTPCIRDLRSLHGHLHGFYFLTSLLKVVVVVKFLISTGIVPQILGPRYKMLT